ncbi:hypothetical protein GCM10009127_14420 [Alteraurantiacibacter aestuarii]|uniref:Extensin n=1 Tax=Alteraurantiacibacter aestuarii TaxID=650004 RepID=A0A844ZLQ4_9SPHN|nr:extensin family protein [Alteraurantiacibacter aestuarii]MXO87970.1 extensin [Alteraurantiacibacter aestuarii]
MTRFAIIAMSAALLSGCSVVPESRGQQRAAPRAQQSVTVATAARPQESQCLTRLGQAGVQFSPLPDRYTGEGCSNIGTVQLTALRSDITTMAVSNIGPVQCDVGNVFASWARFGVDRAARQLLGSPLQRIETMGSYSCRNVAGSARRSAHATAGAIDVAAFILADGRRISVADDWNNGSSAEREFLRVVQGSACRRFATVLGPEYNAAHRDHFHVEGVMEGSSFCR